MNLTARLGVLLILIAAIACLIPVQSVAAQDSANPDIPATPLSAVEIISAQPFTLEVEATHYWRMERPKYSSGYILVLKVDPDAVWPRQAAQPVLYVGNQTAERFNRGNLNGHVVVFVPGTIDDPKAEDAIDLRRSPIWFGDPILPERVDAAEITVQRRIADQAGIRPMPVDMINRALERGSQEVLELENKQALVDHAVDLVIEHAPEELDFIRTHRPDHQTIGQ